MTRLPERLPAAFSERTASTVATLLDRASQEVEIAIGGIPFRLATYDQAPQAVETIPLRKQQFDAEADPGEQSLSFWWRRSQDSFHEGAGNLYAESRDNVTATAGFYDSRGVDPWTKGQITLLPAMTAKDVGFFSRISVAADLNGTLVSSAVGGGDFYVGTPGVMAVLQTPPTNIVDGFCSGNSFYTLTETGVIYQGLQSAPGSATSVNLNLTGGHVPTRLSFGKHRLWVIAGRALYQPDMAGGGLTPLFVHPNQGWRYTAIAEGPTAMYFAGHDGRTSSIQAVALDSSGGVPALTGAAVTAILPDGELIQEIAVLAGQFIGIGTNKGFRVGTIGASGEVAYGPLLFEPDGVVACTALATTGRFFRVAFNSTDPSETWKVDTSIQLSEGVFPYARDVEAGVLGYINSLAEYDGAALCTVSDGGVYMTGTTPVATGYLQTGRIRYRTSENKIFKSVELETEPLIGTIAVEGIEETGTFFDIATLDDTGEAGSVPLGILSSLGPQRQMAFRFTLAPTGDVSPVLNSYLVRALPSVKPQREITLPLLCFDQETGRSGQRYGHRGYGAERLAALQELEDVGDIITYQDFTFLTPVGSSCVINSIQFIQTAPPQIAGGAGGILIVKLGTATA